MDREGGRAAAPLPVRGRSRTSDDQIRYAVSAATDDEALLEDFFLEGALLLDAPPELATTMLVAPQYAGDIEQFTRCTSG